MFIFATLTTGKAIMEKWIFKSKHFIIMERPFFSPRNFYLTFKFINGQTNRTLIFIFIFFIHSSLKY